MKLWARIGIALSGALGSGAAAWFLLSGQKTVDSDATGEPVKTPPVQKGAETLGARAVEVLSYYVGAYGSGAKGSPGYHRGDVIDKINRGFHNDAGEKLLGQPWCARAVRYAYEVAASELEHPPTIGPLFPAKLGTLAMAKSWRESPFDVHLLSSAKVGAALIIKTKAGYHAALIAQVLGPLSVVTVEGNHIDTVASVKRTIDLSKDAIVDVEAWATTQPTTVVGDLDFFAADSA